MSETHPDPGHHHRISRACPWCGYSLKGLEREDAEIRCPECGKVSSVTTPYHVPDTPRGVGAGWWLGLLALVLGGGIFFNVWFGWAAVALAGYALWRGWTALLSTLKETPPPRFPPLRWFAVYFAWVPGAAVILIHGGLLTLSYAVLRGSAGAAPVVENFVASCFNLDSEAARKSLSPLANARATDARILITTNGQLIVNNVSGPITGSSSEPGLLAATLGIAHTYLGERLLGLHPLFAGLPLHLLNDSLPGSDSLTPPLRVDRSWWPRYPNTTWVVAFDPDIIPVWIHTDKGKLLIFAFISRENRENGSFLLDDLFIARSSCVLFDGGPAHQFNKRVGWRSLGHLSRESEPYANE